MRGGKRLWLRSCPPHVLLIHMKRLVLVNHLEEEVHDRLLASARAAYQRDQLKGVSPADGQRDCPPSPGAHDSPPIVSDAAIADADVEVADD